METLTGRIKSINAFVGPNQRDNADVFFLYMEFEGEITPVHPYIHARTTACRMRTVPRYARFYWNGKECVLYEKSCFAGVFHDREEGLAFSRGLIDLINGTYLERNAILPAEPDRDPMKALEVLRLVPRNNCGECAHASCLAFSVAVSEGKISPWACPRFPKPVKGRAAYLVEGMERPITVDMELGPAVSGSPAQDSGNISSLTKREVQVLELMALGFSNREIAENLAISTHTVKTHTVHIFEKLDCADRVEASVWASRAGLV